MEIFRKIEVGMVLSKGGKRPSVEVWVFFRSNMELHQQENIENEFLGLFENGNPLSVSFDNNLESLVDFEIPEYSEVCVDSDLWADLDLSFFEGPEKESETLDESVFLNERQEEGDNGCEGVVHVDVGGYGEGLDENEDLDQSEVVAPIEESVFQSEVIDGIIPRFELRQWSCDVWEGVPHQNVFCIKIVEGVNHYGPGWWADFPLAQQEILRAEIVSEYRSQPGGVFKIGARFCRFNEESLLVLVSILYCHKNNREKNTYK